MTKHDYLIYEDNHHTLPYGRHSRLLKQQASMENRKKHPHQVDGHLPQEEYTILDSASKLVRQPLDLNKKIMIVYRRQQFSNHILVRHPEVKRERSFNDLGHLKRLQLEEWHSPCLEEQKTLQSQSSIRSPATLKKKNNQSLFIKRRMAMCKSKEVQEEE